MSKILVIQALYNLSDERMEFQILDRYFFSVFLASRKGPRSLMPPLYFVSGKNWPRPKS